MLHIQHYDEKMLPQLIILRQQFFMNLGCYKILKTPT